MKARVDKRTFRISKGIANQLYGSAFQKSIWKPGDRVVSQETSSARHITDSDREHRPSDDSYHGTLARSRSKTENISASDFAIIINRHA